MTARSNKKNRNPGDDRPGLLHINESGEKPGEYTKKGVVRIHCVKMGESYHLNRMEVKNWQG